jgi:hypothetical protein
MTRTGAENMIYKRGTFAASLVQGLNENALWRSRRPITRLSELSTESGGHGMASGTAATRRSMGAPSGVDAPIGDQHEHARRTGATTNVLSAS